MITNCSTKGRMERGSCSKVELSRFYSTTSEHGYGVLTELPIHACGYKGKATSP